MTVLVLVYVGLLFVTCKQVSIAQMVPLVGVDNEGATLPINKDQSQGLASLLGDISLPSAANDAVSTVPNGDYPQDGAHNHLLTQRELRLLMGEHFPLFPYGKYLVKPFRELNIPSSLLYQGGKMWISRARRYAYPGGSQSFLRFGRRFKRPREAKDTAFLRFGRSDNKTPNTDRTNPSN